MIESYRDKLDKLVVEATNLGIIRLLTDIVAEAELALSRGNMRETNHAIEVIQRQVDWFAQHDCISQARRVP